MSKVYVVIDEFYGTIADVNVYKNKPKNLKKISEDESQRCFELEIKENEWMEFFILILGILLYVLDSTQEEDKNE